MSGPWDKGLEHYAKGNYYAARDFWQLALANAQTFREQARASNSLGVAAFLLANPEDAMVCFERANALSLRSETADPFRIRYITNLAHVLLYSDHNDVAVKTALAAAKLASVEQAEDSANAFCVCVSVFLRNELYRDVIRLYDHWQAIQPALPEAGRERKTASFLHNLGYAAQAVNDSESALHFYQEAIRTYALPATHRELSKLYLLAGEVSTSLAHAETLYDALWDHEMLSQKTELAETLVLVGMFAYHAGQHTLFENCVEKAELYFGQMSRWDEWLQMRDLGAVLAAHPARVPATALDWERWTSFLADLTLSDSLESLFPGMFRMAQIATHLAHQLATQLDLTEEHHTRRLLSAGRLAYLGLTALSPNETEARRTLRDAAATQEMTELSVRLLDVYPHCKPHRDLIRYSRLTTGGDPVEIEDVKLANCLGISFDYVERVEIGSMSHDQAVRSVMKDSSKKYHSDVIEQFVRHMDVVP